MTPLTRSEAEQRAFDRLAEGNQTINTHGDPVKAAALYRESYDFFQEAVGQAVANHDHAAIERCEVMGAQAHENIGRAQRNDW